MGHELTNLFILAGSLFLLFIGYLAYQLASTEKGTRNLLLFFVVCILIFIFSIHFLMYRFENASEAQPKIIEKYEIVRGKTEQLIQGKGFGKFEVTERSARTGINPATKEKIEIPASKSVKFKPSKALKDQVK